MHVYEHVAAADEVAQLPPIDSRTFTSADDLASWATLDHTIGWKTWPEVWHLDDAGRFQCWYRASSLDSIRTWAEDPTPLRRSRREGLASPGGCTDRWLIIESRPLWMWPGSRLVDPSDEAAYRDLRHELDSIGVQLVDVVVFDDQCHWWSLRELTSGSTAWDQPEARLPPRADKDFELIADVTGQPLERLS